MIVGVNRYQEADEKPIEILHIDAALEQKQIDLMQAPKERSRRKKRKAGRD